MWTVVILAAVIAAAGALVLYVQGRVEKKKRSKIPK